MNKIIYFALGGMDEYGKCTYVIGVDEEYFVFDSGTMIPNNEILGIKKIMPDASWLATNASKIKGLFITQAHYANIGAIPHILKNLPNLPIYASPFSKFVLQEILGEINVKANRITEVHPYTPLMVGKCKVTPFRTFSNMVQSLGYILATPAGNIVHMQDAMVSNDRNVTFSWDHAQTAACLGSAKTLLLSCGANLSSRPGFTAPLHRIQNFFDRSIREWEKRVLISFHKHELYRILSVLTLCKQLQRPVAIFDKRLRAEIDFLISSRIYNGENLTLIGNEKIESEEKCVVILAGESDMIFHTLSKIASGYEELIKLKSTDLFISAANPLEANELQGTKAIEDMSRNDVTVIDLPANVVPPRASVEDLKTFINFFRPEYIIPCSGLYMDFVEFAKAAKETGFNVGRNFFIIYNGDAVRFEGNHPITKNNYLSLHEQYIDAVGVSEGGSLVLQEREQMSNDGVVIVAAGLDRRTKEPITSVEVQLRGVMAIDDSAKGLIDKMQKSVLEIITASVPKDAGRDKYDMKEVRTAIKKKVAKIIEKSSNKKPVILPSIMEIG